MLILTPCIIGDGWTAEYLLDGVCVTVNECFDPCPLASAADCYGEAARRVEG